ncbi:MAG: hypothetical protein N2439_08565 [Anaerolineae bacterium]|nr:hypothetical protein [Anaerolineae bacterium]
MSEGWRLDPAVATLIEESLALERAGDLAAALRTAQQALDAAHAIGENEAIASALVAVARYRCRLG